MKITNWRILKIYGKIRRIKLRVTCSLKITFKKSKLLGEDFYIRVENTKPNRIEIMHNRDQHYVIKILMNADTFEYLTASKE